jgi:phenylacetate-coenzyme A ligase PaaK-like adenylate-forming protein
MNPAFFVNPSLRRQFDEATARRAASSQLDAAAVARGQLERVRTVWADAVADVPYYAQLVATGQAPASVGHWNDVAAIPVLTRRILQDRAPEFVRRSAAPATFMTTAGSTGTPLRLGMNQAERDLMRVVKLSAWQAFGYQPSSRLFLIWGHAHLLGTGWKGRVNHLKRRMADAALGYRRVDAYHLTEASCAAYAEELIRFHPLGLIGYASALDLFARYTGRFRARFRQLGLRFVLSTAEAPPRPDTIPLLEDHFACPVVQEYGGAEFGQVAFKVSGAPFETYSDLNYVEAEAPEADEPRSRPLLVTSLYSRYVPLMRYRVGDGVDGLDVMPHGHLRRFREVAGRLNDIIQLGAGDAVHSVAVFHCIHHEQVHNIQMVLRDDGIEVRLVSSETDRPAMEARIRQRLAQVHPVLAGVQFRYLEDLETNRAGKRRWFVDQRTQVPCAASPAS